MEHNDLLITSCDGPAQQSHMLLCSVGSMLLMACSIPKQVNSSTITVFLQASCVVGINSIVLLIQGMKSRMKELSTNLGLPQGANLGL